MQGKFGLDFADGCGRLHLKGAPFFVGDVLDKHHSTKELEPFSCFSDDVTFEIQAKYDSLDWIGLDKAYWRFDKGSKWTTDIIPYYGHKAQFAQIGPGINHQAQNQKQDATPNISGDVTFGETYLKVAPSSWVEVLNNGLATEVGLKTQANFIDQSLSSNRVFTFSWNVTITGKTWP